MADKRLIMPTTIAQVIVKYLQDGQPMENVMYCQKLHQDIALTGFAPADFDGGAADHVNDQVTAWLTTFWAGFAPTNCECVGTEIVWNTAVGTGPLEGRSYTGSPYPIVGTNDTGPLPNNVTIAVSLRTKLLGRSFHGRVYMVGIGKGQVDDSTPNQIKPAEVSDIVDGWESFRTSLSATTGVDPVLDKFPLGVASFRHDKADRTEAVFTEGDHFTLSDTYLDSQRRRLPAHNRHGRHH